MIMERMRWLAAVLAAFITGWVGHAVYDLRSEQRLPPPAPIAQDAASPVPAPSEVAVAEVAAAPPVAAPVDGHQTAEQEERPTLRPDQEDADAETFIQILLEEAETGPGLRTPGAAEALERAVEQANADWFAAFRAEPVESPWAPETELKLRLAFAQSPLWRNTEVETIECRSRHCLATVVRGITRLSPAEASLRPASAFPGLQMFVGPPARVAANPRVFRQQVFFIRPVVTPGG